MYDCQTMTQGGIWQMNLLNYTIKSIVTHYRWLIRIKRYLVHVARVSNASELSFTIFIEFDCPFPFFLS